MFISRILTKLRTYLRFRVARSFGMKNYRIDNVTQSHNM